TVYTYEDTYFQAVASSDQNLATQQLTNPSTSIAWSQDQAVATLENSISPENTSERVWSVVSPVRSTTGESIALINTKLSVADAEALAEQTFRQSFYILAGTIAIILLLLLNHFRFIEYAKLFRRLKE